MAVSCFLASAGMNQPQDFLYDSGGNLVPPVVKCASRALKSLMLRSPASFADSNSVASLRRKLYSASAKGLV